MDDVFVVNPETKTLVRVKPVSFRDINVRERDDLAAWIRKYPEVLGEEFLIVSSEFDHFDRSDRRLDILALDKRGVVTVIELKLDLSRSFADQQAIRYAAFCSTMTMDDLLDAYVTFHSVTEDDAELAIVSFLGRDDLPEIGNRPRIVLAAGSLDDQELTSTVLWLRSFEVDITCIELTPYRLPDHGTLILVPKILIPLPEAKNYLVRAEKKDAQLARGRAPQDILDLWRAIFAVWAKVDCEFRPKAPAKDRYMKLNVGSSSVHYEWTPLKGQRVLRMALHFESSDRDWNLSLLRRVQDARTQVTSGVKQEFSAGPWGEKWAAADFRIPYDDSMRPVDVAPEAVSVMKLLIDRTWPLIKDHLR
jgi:hypothetical protein